MRETDGTNTKSDLGVVLQRYLGKSISKDQGKSDWGVPDLTPEQLRYAADDVRYLHDLLRAQETAVAEAKLETTWRLEQRLALVVLDMTARGFAFDAAGITAPKAETEQRLTEAEQLAQVWFADPALNLNSPKQLLPAFVGKGVTLADTTEDGLRANGSEGALMVLDYRKYYEGTAVS